MISCNLIRYAVMYSTPAKILVSVKIERPIKFRKCIPPDGTPVLLQTH